MNLGGEKRTRQLLFFVQLPWHQMENIFHFGFEILSSDLFSALTSCSLSLGGPSFLFSVFLGWFGYKQHTAVCDCFVSLSDRMVNLAFRGHWVSGEWRKGIKRTKENCLWRVWAGWWLYQHSPAICHIALFVWKVNAFIKESEDQPEGPWRT